MQFGIVKRVHHDSGQSGIGGDAVQPRAQVNRLGQLGQQIGLVLGQHAAQVGGDGSRFGYDLQAVATRFEPDSGMEQFGQHGGHGHRSMDSMPWACACAFGKSATPATSATQAGVVAFVVLVALVALAAGDAGR